jgi:FAD/FMN-containing dehydrogenase
VSAPQTPTITTTQSSNFDQAASVGVGGLTLGGGISHHTNALGLACDNVASYEIVLASGRIFTASPSSHPDLFWALRGSGPNFGIVTTFHYSTFSQGPMFSSKRQYNDSSIPALFTAFSNAVIAADHDPKLAHFVSIALVAGQRFTSTKLEYSTPVSLASPPPILSEYLAIPSLVETSLNTSLALTTPSLSNSMPPGFWATMWSASFALSTPLMLRLADLFFAVAPSMPATTPSQAFSVPALRAMQKNGGNALGLHPKDGPVVHVLLYMSWEDRESDEGVRRVAEKFMGDVKEAARDAGVKREYVYMLYSSAAQDVLRGYGSVNWERLREVKRKYDPGGVWGGLVRGHFGFGDAPAV